MKIAVVVHNGVRADARVIRQARTLAQAGHEVRIYGLTPEEGAARFTIDGTVPVRLVFHSRPSGPLRPGPLGAAVEARTARETSDPGALRQALKVAGSFCHQGRLLAEAVAADPRPDIVHIHDHVALTAAAFYRTELNVPVVWDAHEIYEALAGLEDVRKYVNPAIIAEGQGYIDRFITISDSIAAFYARSYPDLPDAVIVPNAAEYTAPVAYDGRLHAAAGLPRSQRILLFQGGFAAHRGIPQLLEAAPRLDPRWSVVFMGWGGMRPEMERIAGGMPPASDGVPRASIIDGAPHDELMSWTAGASLGAIPYENTGLNHLYCTPNKLWEYPMAGVPILATDLVELGRAVRKNGIGLLLPETYAAEDIVAALAGLDDALLNDMRKACMRYARADNWQTYEGRLLSCYQSFRAGLLSRFKRILMKT